MFVDASAVVSMIALEPDAGALAARLQAASGSLASPVVIYEATLAIARLKRRSIPVALKLTEEFFAAARVSVVPIDAAIAGLALEAFGRYGKGRHKANLNMGDCFAYACARAHKVPLLYKGKDFALTDIEAA